MYTYRAVYIYIYIQKAIIKYSANTHICDALYHIIDITNYK